MCESLRTAFLRDPHPFGIYLQGPCNFSLYQRRVLSCIFKGQRKRNIIVKQLQSLLHNEGLCSKGEDLTGFYITFRKDIFLTSVLTLAYLGFLCHWKEENTSTNKIKQNNFNRCESFREVDWECWYHSHRVLREKQYRWRNTYEGRCQTTEGLDHPSTPGQA